MQIYKHAFALIFILLLIVVIIFLSKKGNLHLKLLKKLYPKQLKKINSIYNPLIVIYVLSLEADILLWFSLPIYFSKSRINKSSDKEIIKLNTKLKRNNNRIYFSIAVLLLWLLVGILFFQ